MIIGCEHHDGMGLCTSCVREQQASEQRDRDATARLRHRVAKALAKMGDYQAAASVSDGSASPYNFVTRLEERGFKQLASEIRGAR